MSKRVIKSTQVILDDKKFVLSPKVVPSIKPELEEDLEEQAADDSEGVGVPQMTKEDVEDMLEQANTESREILKRAEQDAEQIISEAYEKAKGIMEQARQDGYAEGHAEGFEKGRVEAQGIVDEAMNVKHQAVLQYKELLVNAEPELIELTLDIIERILRKHVEEDRAVIEGLIKSALEKCAYTENLTLRVAPEDYDYAINIRDRILALSENLDTINIKNDPSLEAGSCVIDTEAGSVDSSIWTQFEQIKSTFVELLQSE